MTLSFLGGESSAGPGGGKLKCCPDRVQVVVIFAGTQGFADKIAVGDITTYESRLLDAVRDKGADILATITEEKALSDDTSEKLKKFLDDFTKSFAA